MKFLSWISCLAFAIAAMVRGEDPSAWFAAGFVIMAIKD